MPPTRRLHLLAAHLRAISARHRRLLTIVAACLVLLSTTTLVAGVWFAYVVASSLPGADALRRTGLMDQATTVFDDQDRPAFTIYKEQRIEVPLARMSPHLIDATLAIEDQRFFEHGAVDPVRLAGALVANLRKRRAAQGGSTISQQLARQSFLTPEKTVRRKVAELLLAGRLERLYSKRQILEMYLNRVYFGDGYYGVEAASLGYFAVHAADLSVAQAAVLAGLVRAPSAWSPSVSRTKAVARRNVVLMAMLECGKISPAQWRAARAEPLVLHNGLERRDAQTGQYFKEQVRRELVARFGWPRVYQGGLRVYTTFDANMQQAAEEAVKLALAELDAQRARRRPGPATVRTASGALVEPVPPVLQAALVALDPGTGAVRAMVGGRDFGDSPFNRATQARRQPGSAFKPFIYAQALEAGLTPATLVEGLDSPVATEQGPWSPRDEHSDVDAMTLRTGLRTSSNRAAVRLLQIVGQQRTLDYARMVGLGALPDVPSLALGSGEVTPLALADAYVPFANGGMARPAFLIRRVEDRDGRVLFAAADQSRRALSDTDAFLMAQMLADVVDAGTGNRARQLGFRLPAAGKTGTTNNFNDAWFIGFTPRLLAGVWVGYDDPQTIAPNAYAADVAVPLWTRFMRAATSADKPDWFALPASVVPVRVCRLSRRLAADGCEHVPVVSGDGTVDVRSMVYTEYFARGTEPTAICQLHGLASGVSGAVETSGSLPAPLVEPPAPVALPPGHREPAARTVATPAATAPDAGPAGETAAPPKPRGFWARLFGIHKKKGK